MNGNNVLLPSNATRLERSLSSASDPSGRLWNVIDAISLFKSVPQDGILAFLIWEYGLGEIQPFISDPRKLIEEGVAWQRLIEPQKPCGVLWDGLGFLPLLKKEIQSVAVGHSISLVWVHSITLNGYAMLLH